MPKARKEQISLNNTPYYHCISRCVRRAFLCGSDPLSGKDYQHRKQWMAERLTHLAQVFSIEIYAYSLMDNHSHLVLKAIYGWPDYLYFPLSTLNPYPYG